MHKSECKEPVRWRVDAHPQLMIPSSIYKFWSYIHIVFCSKSPDQSWNKMRVIRIYQIPLFKMIIIYVIALIDSFFSQILDLSILSLLPLIDCLFHYFFFCFNSYNLDRIAVSSIFIFLDSNNHYNNHYSTAMFWDLNLGILFNFALDMEHLCNRSAVFILWREIPSIF
jgi:hypothetical protein